MPNHQAIGIKRLPHAQDLPLPMYQTTSASGVDLYAAIEKPIAIESGNRALIPTGIALAIPVGFEGQLRPRSGLALKHGITLLNSPGTIDSDYRGEIMILLINLGSQTVTISRGQRIAQCVINAVTKIVFEETQDLPLTRRGNRGFGHTGQ